MAQIEKLKAAFRACAGPFPWKQFEQLISKLGYRLQKKSGGSARTFTNPTTKDVIRLHEPHDGEMKPQMVTRLRDHLNERGLL